MGLRKLIEQRKVKGRIALEQSDGKRILAAIIKDPDGGLLIHRAIEQAEAV